MEAWGGDGDQLTVDSGEQGPAQPLFSLFKGEIITLNQSHKSSAFISWVPGVIYIGRKKGHKVDQVVLSTKSPSLKIHL